MPGNVNERLWNRAKKRAADRGHKDDFRYIMKIYEAMGGTFKSTPLDRIKMGRTL